MEALEIRDATARAQAVIVQPRVALPTYRRLAAHRHDDEPSDDVLRLHLVESLTGAALAVVGRGAQFTVIGSAA